MADKICKVAGCPKIVNNRGLCSMHWWRLKNHGDVNYVKPPLIRPKCKIDGCEKTARKRGWCGMHYDRWLLRGDPNIVLLPKDMHGMSGHLEYSAWHAMKGRCMNQNDPKYLHYGGRGIKVCKRWRDSFRSFYEDVGSRPNGKSLDRKDNDGNYSCGHCNECLANGWTANWRWATQQQQVRNQRTIRSTNKSGYRGVSRKRTTRWQASIGYQGKSINLGSFATALEAARAYNAAALKYHGLDANLNELPAQEA